jgi:hypothetical protein
MTLILRMKKHALGGAEVLNNWDCRGIYQSKPLKMITCYLESKTVF